MNVSPRTAATAAGVAAAGFAVSGTVQLLDVQSSESTTVGIEHLGLAAFSVYTIALAFVSVHLGRLAGAPLVGLAAGAGSLVLGVLGCVSNAAGEDPAFFDAVAAPANLVWLAGTVALAVLLHRRGAATLPVAVSLPFSYALAIPLSTIGGGILAAAYWLVAARLLLEDEEQPLGTTAQAGVSSRLPASV